MLETLDTQAITEANWILINQQLLPLLERKDKLKAIEDIELEKAVAIAIQVLQVGDFQTRWDVAKIFPKIGEKAIAPLLEILHSEQADSEIRWFALRILGEFNQPYLVISLVKFLEETQEEELALYCAQTLAKIGQPAITALIQLLKDEKSRLLAVKSLAQIRRSEIIEPLLSVVDDSNVEVRITAVEALSSFHQKGLIPVFIKALKDTSAKVRKEAIIALKMRGDLKKQFDLVNHLQPLVYDINSEVGQQAVLALGCMRDETAIAVLFNVLSWNNAALSLKKEAVRALNWSGSMKALDYLKYCLNNCLKSSDIGLCEEIIAVLGRQESTELKSYAAKIVIDFLNSEQEIALTPQIKQAIATSLGELRDSVALTHLEKLTFDDDSKVKLYAKAAIKKFTAVEK